ncbi:MAG: P-loop NTPase [Proteobacteria bacterium]|nr:P-loop NTPase [Pseudomonadota bacterium]
MIISVASGKGGTGKTTVSANLAVSIEDRVRFLDCDVEEPNAHIFLKPDRTERETVRTMVPVVNHDSCCLCGACQDICRFSAIVQVAETVMTFPDMCHSCRGCLMVCPTGAISESTRELGEIVRGDVGEIELVYGRLRVGEAMSPPLIEKVKEEADREGTTIIDAPPGTSCPVIAAIRDSDFVVLVTEPTPFGLNDLKLAVETVRIMNLPFGIVINRCDTGTDATKRYATQEGIPILMEIPDRREIAESYSKGILMVEAFPEMKKAFQQLFSEIVERRRAHFHLESNGAATSDSTVCCSFASNELASE